MRVLILTPVFPHPGSPTEGLFNADHAAALAAAGAAVTVVVTKPWLPPALARVWPRYRTLADLPAPERRGDVDVRFCRYLHLPGFRAPGLTVAACARAIRAALQERAGAWDVVQAHSLWPVGLAAPAVAAALGAPYVVTAHIRDDDRLVRGGGARLYRRMLRAAAAVVAVGTPLVGFLEELEAEGVPAVRRIPNGADLAAAHRAVAAVDPGTRTGWGRVVSVSSLWPVKGIDYNLRALALLAERGRPWTRYTVVGDGPERGRLEGLAQELGIAERVTFTGRLDHDAALAEVAAADVFSLPSWQEAFGVVYVEALACGKPAVGCRGQGAEDVIRPGRDGLLVEPRDVASLAEALGRLLGDAAYARELGRAGPARAAELTWERNAAHYLALYEELLSTP